MIRRCAIKQNGFYRLATAIKYPVSAVRRYGILSNLLHKLEEGERGRQAVLRTYDWREIAKSIAEECEKVVSNIDGR